MSEQYSLRNLKVAGILDELSDLCFPHECQYKNLSYDNWEQELDEFQPQLLFVESAWQGKNGKWARRVYNCDPDFIGVLNWFRKKGLPTVFWCKEDPVHFDTFLGAASHFDWVFTTDMDCVPLYKRFLGHDNVGVFPFAVEPAIFTPIEKYERKPGCCFAGSYYAKQKERCEDFAKIVDLLNSKMPFVIYDRNAYPDNPDRVYPEPYQGMIVGSLPVSKIDVAYKGYDWSLTMNIVKRSSTMEARRIFELLACNTLSVSNPCSGIKTLLGDLVLQDLDNVEEFDRRATDKMYGDRIRLLGLRKVLNEHTYYHRMVSICKLVLDKDYSEPSDKVCCFSSVKNQKEIDKVVASFNRIEYADKTLTVFIPEKLKIKNNAKSENIKFVKNKKIENIREIADADYYCYLNPENYYGTMYLTDLLLTRRYSSASIFGKNAYYKWQNNGYTAVDSEKAYIVTDGVLADRCIINKTAASVLCLNDFVKNIRIEGFVTMSTDMFHFCEGFNGDFCADVEDVNIDCGVDMEHLYNFACKLPSDDYFKIQFRRSGAELAPEFLDSPRVYKTTELYNGTIGAYSLVQETRYIKLSDNLLIDDFSNDGVIWFYLGAYSRNTKFAIQFKDADEKPVRSNVIFDGQYFRCVVPENGKYFSLLAVIGKDSVFAINEFVINAFPNECIKISDKTEEKE